MDVYLFRMEDSVECFYYTLLPQATVLHIDKSAF